MNLSSSAATQAPDRYRVFHDLPYADNGNALQKLDLYVPTEAESGPVPLIVWIHGGGWIEGDKRQLHLHGITERGYALASINYRLAKEAPYPAQLDDCMSAIRFLRSHAREYCINKDAIGVWGESAGAHLALLVAFTSAGSVDAVQGVCDWCAPTDLTRPIKYSLFPQAKHALRKDGHLYWLLDKQPYNKKLAHAASPIFHVTKDCPPVLIMHGEKTKEFPCTRARHWQANSNVPGSVIS